MQLPDNWSSLLGIALAPLFVRFVIQPLAGLIGRMIPERWRPLFTGPISQCVANARKAKQRA